MRAEALRALLWLLAGSLPPTAAAQTIFKCVDEGETGYQARRCAAGTKEVRMTIGVPSARPEVLAPTPQAVPAGGLLRKAGPWKHTKLTLGMSDDEVLNLRGWGRPGRITRVRMPREWREEWVYLEGTLEEQHLYFANARLVDIVAVPAANQLAEAPARPTQD